MYSVKTDLELAVEKIQELQELVVRLKEVMPPDDYRWLAGLASAVATHLDNHHSLILKDRKN